ncbi:dCTP deaminase [archaeon]|nr:dCTP deaminase [archaeon]
MILSKEEILKRINNNEVVIKPFNKKNIESASIDLTLGNEFRIFTKDHYSANASYQKVSRLIKEKEIILQPDDFVLGITKEHIKLPKNLCGWLQGRSRYARLGITIHITASFLHPGIDNKQVLEIKNDSNSTIKLKSGMKICQLILEELKGFGLYKGKYRYQRGL